MKMMSTLVQVEVLFFGMPPQVFMDIPPRYTQLQYSSSLPPPYSPQPLSPLPVNDILSDELATFRTLDAEWWPAFSRALREVQRSADPNQWGLYRHGQLLAPVEHEQEYGMIDCSRWFLEMVAPVEENLMIEGSYLGTATEFTGVPFAMTYLT
ncbi:hypothetical protein L804_04685 [Cryptococcus deuterogattii 2001/935-1]|nr:hypothetical protein L804_04685 [Cryptococcus deuterogattii 2001/935-1]